MAVLVFLAGAHISILSFPQEVNASSNQALHYDVVPHESEAGHIACSKPSRTFTSVRASHNESSPDQVPCALDSYATDLLPLLHRGSPVLFPEDIPPDLPLDQKTILLL